MSALTDGSEKPAPIEAPVDAEEGSDPLPPPLRLKRREPSPTAGLDDAEVPDDTPIGSRPSATSRPWSTSLPSFDPSHPLPASLLTDPEMIDACAARDIGSVFDLAKRYAGLYDSRIARLVKMTPSRVADYRTGRSMAHKQSIIERVADGLRIPGPMLGLAARPWERGTDEPSFSIHYAVEPSRAIDRADIAPCTGDVLEEARRIEVSIDAYGVVETLVGQTIRNLGTRPLAGITEEIPGEQATPGLPGLEVRLLTTKESPTRPVLAHLVEAFYSVRFSTPLPPGEAVDIVYLRSGEKIVDAFSWRQTILRSTEHFSLSVRRHSDCRTPACGTVTAYRELGGAAASNFLADCTGESAMMQVSRRDLAPGQIVTATWRMDS